MEKIKVAEIFGGNKKGGTLQGEALFAGIPSVFLRTFGCNKRCKGFSLPRGQETTEVIQINPANYKSYDELPLVNTGCDTYAAVYPQFNHFSPMMEIPEIVDKIQGLLQSGKFNQDCHLILTGGEPLLGWQKSYPALIDEIFKRDMGLTDLTFETNGTQFLSDKMVDYLNYSSCRLRTTFSVSAKLPCSGETWESSILPDRIIQYQSIHKSIVYLKFVVSTEEDFEDVHKAVKEYRDSGFNGPVYVMPAGGTVSTYSLTEKAVAELAIEHGYRFSSRLQINLFGNQWGT